MQEVLTPSAAMPLRNALRTGLAVLLWQLWQPCGVRAVHRHHLYTRGPDELPAVFAGTPTMTCSQPFIPDAWVPHLESPDSSGSRGGAVLFGTAYAQQQIYRHQHPADCKACARTG